MKAEILVRKNSWRDYAALTKPRVVLLHLVTTAAAMFLAAGGLPRLSILAATLLGGALVAGAANVLNCYFDRDIDKAMARTSRRPLPAGRLSADQAFIFGLITGLAGVWILTRFVGIWVAVLAVAAMLYYVLLVYPAAEAPQFLEHRDWQRRRGFSTPDRVGCRHRAVSN